MSGRLGSSMYQHTQYGYWHLLLIAGGVLMFIVSQDLPPEERVGTPFLIAGGVILVVISLAFQHLTIRDEGDVLAVRFGPLPLFGITIRYADIESFERGKTSILEGWGMHWGPRHGWTINIWGFDCVVIRLKGRSPIRLGTDDPEGLCNLLQMKLLLVRPHEQTPFPA